MHCFLIAAMSVDGFIAHEASEMSTKWTSKADARWFGQKTKEAGVCVMGKTTYATVGRPLPGRLTIVLSKAGQPLNPERLSELHESWQAWKTRQPEKTLGSNQSQGVPLLSSVASVSTEADDRDMSEQSTEKSSEWSAGIVLTTSDCPSIIKAKIDQADFPTLAVCGGASIYTQFLQERLVETLYLTIEPQLFGSGIRLANAALTVPLQYRQTHQLSAQTFVLEYSIDGAIA